MTAKTKARKKTKVSRLLGHPGSAASFICSECTCDDADDFKADESFASDGAQCEISDNCRTSIARLGYMSRHNMYFTSSTKRWQERLVALLYKLLFNISIVVALGVLVQSGALWCLVLLEAAVCCSVHVSCAKDVLVQSIAEHGALCYRVWCTVVWSSSPLSLSFLLSLSLSLSLLP